MKPVIGGLFALGAVYLAWYLNRPGGKAFDGTLYDLECNTPITSALVRLEIDGKVHGPVGVDNHGHFHFDDVEGTGSVFVEAEGYKGDFKERLTITRSQARIGIPALPVNLGVYDGARLDGELGALQKQLPMTVRFSPSCNPSARVTVLNGHQISGQRCRPKEILEEVLKLVKASKPRFTVNPLSDKEFEIVCQ